MTGTIQLTAAVLSVVMLLLAVTVLERSKREEKVWRMVLLVITLFALEEFLGVFKSFSIFDFPGLTHIIPTAILILLIIALREQIIIKRELGGK